MIIIQPILVLMTFPSQVSPWIFTAKNSQVEMVQRRAARWILWRYNRQYNVSDILNCLGWQTLQSRRTIARLSSLCKFRNNLTLIQKMLKFTQLHTLLQAHLVMLLSYPLLVVKFSIFPKNLIGMEQTAKTSSFGKTV